MKKNNLEEKKYTLPNNLKNMLDWLIKLYKQAHKEIKPEVLYIIKNNIKDIRLIEHTLDKLLNIPTEKCYILFTKLCNYVSKFDKETAEDYLEIYNEIYGEEENIKKKTCLKR